MFAIEDNYVSALEALTIRLELAYGRGNTESLIKSIIAESEKALPDPNEYVLNELQFELRFLHLKSDSQCLLQSEVELVNQWATKLTSRFPLDDILSFITELKNNRVNRFKDNL